MESHWRKSHIKEATVIRKTEKSDEQSSKSVFMSYCMFLIMLSHWEVSTEKAIFLNWVKVSRQGIYHWIWYDKMYKSIFEVVVWLQTVLVLCGRWLVIITTKQMACYVSWPDPVYAETTRRKQEVNMPTLVLLLGKNNNASFCLTMWYYKKTTTVWCAVCWDNWVCGGRRSPDSTWRSWSFTTTNSVISTSDEGEFLFIF